MAVKHGSAAGASLRAVLAAGSMLVGFASPSPAFAQSAWDKCSDGQDVKNNSWDEKIKACRKVTRREKAPERLAIAHFYIAENLGNAHYAFVKTGKPDPCNFDKKNFSYIDEQILQSGICYGPALAPLNQRFDYDLSYLVQRIAGPVAGDYEAVLSEYDKALSFSPGNEKITKARENFIRDIDSLYFRRTAPPENTARAQFSSDAKEAEKKFRAGDFSKAKESLDKLIADELFAAQQETFRKSAFFMRGVSRLQLSDPSGAFADFSKSIGIKPDMNAHYQRGRAYTALGDPKNAAADFTKALSMAPDDPATKAELLLQRANQHYAMSAHDQALNDLDAAISAKETGLLFGLRGEIFLHRQEFVKARGDFDRALALGVGDDAARITQIRKNRAAAAAYLGETDAALADYGWIVNARTAPAPERLDAQLSRAIIHHMRGDSVAAMADYDAVFAQLHATSDQARIKAAAIVDGLRRGGLYNGDGKTYDEALRAALAQCVSMASCGF